MPTQSPQQLRDRFAAGKPLWARAIAQPGQEFGPAPLRILAGTLPPGLRGSLYRNGPARLERGGKRVAHWFDGDGAILGVHFREQGAIATYRYVKTQGLQAEDRANQFLYPGYAQKVPGPFWKQWGRPAKNAANTSVIAVQEKLLALWEGGNPHALDLETLETWGLDQLGALTPTQPYSAHPKRDPETGEIYNFGVVPGRQPHLQLYRSDRRGQIQQTQAIPLQRLSLVHDFALAGPYLVFLVPPLEAQLFGLLLGFQSYSEALQWRPEYGTQILVVDRQTLQAVKRFEVEPWYQWHIGNGYTDRDRTVVIDFVRYANFQTNQWLKQVATGYPQTPAEGRLWRLRFDPETGKILDNYPHLELNCEFPVVSPLESTHQATAIYLTAQSHPQAEVAELHNSLVRVEVETGQSTLAEMGAGCYPMEPIFAPDPQQPGQGWILTVVFDGHKDQSTVQIFSAEALDAGPICILELPEMIPFGFHGTWCAR